MEEHLRNVNTSYYFRILSHELEYLQQQQAIAQINSFMEEYCMIFIYWD